MRAFLWTVRRGSLAAARCAFAPPRAPTTRADPAWWPHAGPADDTERPPLS